MNKPILSICIPTYNRAPYLKECLDSLVKQFSSSDIQNQIEIIVANNNSVDNTEEVVSCFVKQYNNIKYFKHTFNIGAVRNVSFLIEQAVGEYFWIIGDDDVVIKDSLSDLLLYLNQKKYSAILLNFSQGEHKNPYILLIENSLNLRHDKVYNDHRLFFAGNDFKNFSGINFLSALIFRLDYYKKHKTEISKFYNCYFQSYVFLFVATEGPILRIANPVVIWRVQEVRRYEQYNNDIQTEEQVIKTFNDYILFSKKLGYVFDESRINKRNLKSELKGKLYRFFTRIHLIRFARIFYRLPRLIKYRIANFTHKI